MAEKIADLDRTLYDLTAEYPELIDALAGLGFLGVRNPVMRESHGRQMTVRSGCAYLGIEEGKVSEALKAKGFTVK
jgi:hypothetical protein